MPVILVSAIYQDGQIQTLVTSMAITAIAGFFIWIPFYKVKNDFTTREGILLVVSFWLILSLFATLPFLLSPALSLSVTDAFFESMSGLTTTGATVISGLDELPKSILYYRQQLQWLGGMGIIVLAVSVLPVLGVGGMSLYNAEVSGISQEKLTPKLAETAKVLWRLYVGFTLACALAYYAGGMSWFDAICHSFSTVAIGGFSTHDASMAYFNSTSIELVAVVFMLLAGINFSLHFTAFQNRRFNHYLRDSEFKAYGVVLLILLVVTYLILSKDTDYANSNNVFSNTLFQVVSIATTTGFVTQDFSLWAGGLPIILILASFIGACAGSTGGGIKVVRIVLMFKLGMREIRRMIYPSSQVNIKLNNKSVPEKILGSVWGFFALYMMAFVAIILSLLLAGLDGITTFSATAATINNLGPGLGDVALNYGNINDQAKWILSFSMLLGRLEILTLMALLHRSFWRY